MPAQTQNRPLFSISSFFSHPLVFVNPKPPIHADGNSLRWLSEMVNVDDHECKELSANEYANQSSKAVGGEWRLLVSG